MAGPDPECCFMFISLAFSNGFSDSLEVRLGKCKAFPVAFRNVSGISIPAGELMLITVVLCFVFFNFFLKKQYRWRRAERQMDLLSQTSERHLSFCTCSLKGESAGLNETSSPGRSWQGNHKALVSELCKKQHTQL